MQGSPPVLPSLDAAAVRGFQARVLEFFRCHGRALPWRATTDPYHILVSELMLQQTQVDRVIPKYQLFLERFPTLAQLGRASAEQVLACWQGLGYNRRALYLRACARQAGIRLPTSYAALLELPGIGPYTAAAVCVFAFNQPRVLLETNIRAVFIHTFWPDAQGVADSQVRPLVEQTLYRPDPRTWFNALMDYGADIKRRYGNPARRSRHHVRQSAFAGSDRQVRGRIIQLLVARGRIRRTDLPMLLVQEPSRIERVVEGLVRDGLVRVGRLYVRLAS